MQLYAAVRKEQTFHKHIGHLLPAEFTHHLYGHWRYLQQNCDISLITLRRSVTEKRPFSRYQLILLQRAII